ncbi:MAG TPA: tryptophan 2,3-dioxygenase family protein [Gemmatimonadales bacterium]|nr:tryptophan 2,3-dioxygenase family protein [Gemmatimonadales bacterium]
MPFGLPDSEQKLTYGGYLRVDELLSLQQLRSDPAQHDETLFIVIHQVYELWFKQLLHELDRLLQHLERDEVLGAKRLLDRCLEIQQVLVQQLRVLETMTTMDFLTFRDHLMPASGFQSAQFREVEFLSGLKDERFARFELLNEGERERLRVRLARPSLRDAFFALCRRRGFAVPDGAGEAAEAARVQGLLPLYREAERHYDLFLLAEALVSYDENFLLWRYRHVQMVERVIGGVRGTGGSEGAGYLRSTMDRRFFPELWALRTDLSARAVASGDLPAGSAGGHLD